MSSSKAHIGYALIETNNNKRIIGANFVNSKDALDAFQADYIGGGYVRTTAGTNGGYGGGTVCDPFYIRASSLRYKNPNMGVGGNSIKFIVGGFGHYYSQYRSNTTNYRYPHVRFITAALASVEIDNANYGRPFAIGSIQIYAAYAYLTSSPSQGFPTYSEGNALISSVDIPGNTIGNMFKHAWDGSRFVYLSGGDIALSQGEYIISGHYEPPENMLQHRAYRIYVTKTGGTGIIVGAVKNNGETFPAATNNYTFKDTTFAGFTAGDVGSYIAIRSGNHIGTFLITAYVDASTVETDAATINESFTNETNLTWTLRTGPIAEYFWNSRPWSKNYDPTSDIFSSAQCTYIKTLGSGYNMPGLTEDDLPAIVVHDGGAFWWTLSIYQGSTSAYRVCRWLHDSPVHIEPVYNNGNIIGMPAGITFWSDLCIDINKKLWFSWLGATAPAPSPNQHKVLAKVDPFPGGDSSAPTALGIYEAQSSASDATGLCSNQPLGIACDHENDVVWIFHGTGTRLGTDQDNGGISYSENNGTTWKRIHRLHAKTGTATVVNGSPNVSGSGCNFTTEWAVGDWIRFDVDTRSYEVITITDNDNIILGSNYEGTGGAYSIQKGALSADDAVILFITNNTTVSTDNYVRAPCDYDSDGNVYWIPSAGNRVCRWSSTLGKVDYILASTLSNDGGYPISALRSIVVPKLPSCADNTDHLFHDAVCIGSYNTGGVIVRKADFTSGNNALWYRYHWSVTTNLATTPYRVKVGAGTSGTLNRFFVDEATGQIYFVVGSVLYYHNILMHPNGTQYTGDVFSKITEASDSYGFTYGGPGLSTKVRYSGVCNLRTFNKWGLSRFIVIDSNLNVSGSNGGLLGIGSGGWSSFGWNGSSWFRMMGNQHYTNIDFSGVEGATIRMPVVPTLGFGTRRAMEIDTPLEFGLRLRFTQSGIVTQPNEYIIDEKATFICSIGFSKDNISDMKFGANYFASPTVNRKAIADVDQIKNIWTVDGGIDGGYSVSASEDALPAFSRGVAEPSMYSSYNNVASYYPNFYDGAGLYASSNPVNMHMMAALRIKDDFELSSDGSVTSGIDTFTSTSYTFVTNDIGKSIFIEGSAQGNNGQYVITAINGNSATVNAIFAGTESNIRWKLRNVPAVGYVVINFERLTGDDASQFLGGYYNIKLYSSSNYGQVWTKVKETLSYSGVTENAGITNYEPEGVTFVGRLFGAPVNNSDLSHGAIIFDLTALPEADRRKQYWKIWRSMIISVGQVLSFSSIQLYDDAFGMLGIPDSLLMPDAKDPLRVGFLNRGSSFVLDDSARLSGALLTATDDGDGDNWTNLLTLSAGSFYIQSGTDGQLISGATPQFVSVSAVFTPEMVGQKLRIPTATTVDPGDSYYGFVTILSVVDANTVTISLNLTSGTGLTWQQTRFGYSDLLYLDSDAVPLSSGLTARDLYLIINDIPTSGTIQLTTNSAPYVAPISTTGVEFYCYRDFAKLKIISGSDYGVRSNGTLGRCGYTDNIGSGEYFMSHCQVFGVQYFTGDTEFISLLSGTTNGSTPTDDDGDGRTDIISVPVDVTTGINAAVVGDYIIVSGGLVGRRVFEIKNVTGGTPSIITVTYDELPVSQSGLTWQIVRRRFFKQHLRESITVAQETL